MDAQQPGQTTQRLLVREDVQREAVEELDALFDDPAVLEIPPRKVKPDEK